MGLLDILRQYADPSTPPTANVDDHFDEVAQQSSSQDLGRGSASALRSDATPPFGQTIGGLFAQSNPQQQAGVLKTLSAVALSAVMGHLNNRRRAPRRRSDQTPGPVSPGLWRSRFADHASRKVGANAAESASCRNS